MKKNFTLFEKVLSISTTKKNLVSEDISDYPSCDCSGPSEYVLNNIFNYAKALSVVKLKKTADYMIILN